jgi:hypothetical protein
MSITDAIFCLVADDARRITGEARPAAEGQNASKAV